MKTLNDLKQQITESKVEEYTIQQLRTFDNTFTIQLTTKEVFSMIGYNVTSFSFAGLPESKACISFTVNF
tara:strand:+ start:263 stop:472 length:210 start_codon:yes stop_codon:yes gene_type:complete